MKAKSKAAQAAAQIREILKKQFPKTNFKIQSGKSSLINWIDISWIGNESKDEVAELIGHYQREGYNGGETIRKDIPQVVSINLIRF